MAIAGLSAAMAIGGSRQGLVPSQPQALLPASDQPMAADYYQAASAPEAPAADGLKTVAAVDPSENLPIGKVDTYEAAGATDTAILIPQIHRNPGSEVADSANDSAEVAQQQIYAILDHLNGEHNVKLVVVEGELNGVVPAQKITRTAEKIRLRERLASQLADLKLTLKNKTADPAAQAGLVRDLENKLAQIDRELMLAGAAYKLKAEGKNVALYGSEDPKTRAKSTEIVRNYIYLNDRLAALSAPNTLAQAGGTAGSGASQGIMDLLARLQGAQPAMAAENSGNGDSSPTLFDGNILNLLARLRGNQNSLDSDLETMTALARTGRDNELSNELAGIRQTLSALAAADAAADASGSEAAPSREDNPYKTVTDQAKLKKLVAQSEQEINSVVRDQRSADAVDGFIDSLDATRQNVGVIQFGAGHEDGLIKEFNRRGVSVLVVTPTEVLRRGSEQ